MSLKQPTIQEVIKEEVIEISLKDFKSVSVTPTQSVERVVKVPHFGDDVPEHLRNAYLLKDWIEHSHKRIRNTLSVKFDDKSVTITEKRTLRKESVTYNFANENDLITFITCFSVDNLDEQLTLLMGVKIANGSIIKTLIRGQPYYDEYYDTIMKKPKYHTMKKTIEGAGAFLVFIATVLPLLGLILI